MRNARTPPTGLPSGAPGPSQGPARSPKFVVIHRAMNTNILATAAGLSDRDLLARLYGRVEPVTEESSAPADRFSLPDGTVFGIISSTTAPFCRSCDRSRLTADGQWYLCLYARTGVDLRGLVRQGNSTDTIRHKIVEAWQARIDRGAEERLGINHRAAFVPVEELRRDPHLEMHTRGG